jgi:hypothetical protein
MSKLDVPGILESGAATYRERNAIYGDSWETFRNVMTALYPNGVSLNGEDEVIIYNWISHIAGKLVRFKNSGYKHSDSMHDISVYAAMIEAYIKPAPQPAVLPSTTFTAIFDYEGEISAGDLVAINDQGKLTRMKSPLSTIGRIPEGARFLDNGKVEIDLIEMGLAGPQGEVK